MPEGLLPAGVATAIGSLPHHDAHAAAALVLRCLPELPAAPELPRRSPYETMIVRWAAAIPEVRIGDDGALDVHPGVCDAAVTPVLHREMHEGLLTFLDAAAACSRTPARCKVQLTGPLTLGVALMRAGMAQGHAFVRAIEAARTWARTLECEVSARLPDAEVVIFFDEPALVQWRSDDPPLERETATDLLSAALAAPGCATGVHVCGAGDARLALDAGPDILAVDVAEVCLDDAVAFARFLEADGWIAWGAVPTDRPVGESASPLWKALLDVWCELTKRGCDPLRLRNQALVTPACGLAGHGPSQAERALCLAREIGCRVLDQAAATRLTVGA
jgi:methionine synthase II (cobalamin-independent)